MDELLDIVDENDVVIKRELYSLAHKNKLLHRGAVVILFKDQEEKQLLILRWSLNCASPGKYDLLGGHVRAYQTYLQTAKKELEEETFNDRNMPELNFELLFKIKKEDSKCRMYIQLYKVVYDGEISLNLTEHSGSSFKTKKDILKLLDKGLFNPSSEILLRRYFNPNL